MTQGQVKQKQRNRNCPPVFLTIITVKEGKENGWECELKPQKREVTLDSIAFTLNHIWLQDHGAKTHYYPILEEEDTVCPMAAEESPK